MKRKCVMVFCLLLFLFSGTAYAEASSASGGTDSLAITDENRYDPIYYQQPEKRYATAPKGRSARANPDLEAYIVDELQQFSTSIDVSAYGISRTEAGAAYFQILNSHPELFYVDGSVKWGYNSSGIVTRYYGIAYRDAQANIQRQQEELEEAAEQALAWVTPSMSDMEKALAVHDYLVLNCEYDEVRRQNGTLPAYSHSAYGALVSNLAVCDGYSHAYAYILENKLGIPCELVTSDSMNHAWSMVSVDGEWYHVDVTWDDPLWDCIGRVKHDYFLLSDTVMADSSHSHSNWSAGHRAASDSYKNAFWIKVSSAFCYQDGNWYYARYDGSSRRAELVKQKDLLGAEGAIAYTENESWNQYSGSYLYLDLEPDSNKIFFNTRTSICRLEGNGTVRTVYEPSLSGNQLIFGFTIKGGQLCYWLQGSPNLQSKQKFSVSPLPELQTPVIDGIFAEDVNTVYDGTAKTITVRGAQPGDRISYAGEDGQYDAVQPEMIQAGTYQVQYKVERDGCEDFLGRASVVIGKASPEYSLPAGLQGVSGSSLGDVGLPPGFVWETESGTKLAEEGTITCYVQYVPEDASNYMTVFHLAVELTVSCPGHQYNSQIIKEPTDTERGQEAYTCEICGDTFIREIDIRNPSIEGISAEDVTAAYDGTGKKITVQGLQPGDTVYYADETGIYRLEQPEMTEAGTYQVLYKVERENCNAFYGTARLEIEKAVPVYAVPTGLQGNSGMAVRDISLPEGFVWQTAEDTYLFQEGTYTYYVKFVPEDSRNYITIPNLAVKVTVSCPGHQYIAKIVRKATRTQKGQEVYTCRICGNSYAKELELQKSGRPGKVLGLKAEKISSDSLKFSWNREEGVKYRLVLYRKNKIVDAKDTSGNSCIFTELQAAASYTLKVRPYWETDGRRVYGGSDGTIQAMTIPAKVKLVSVRQKGSAKAKITWKKAAGADGYEVSMRIGKGGYKKIKTVTKGKAVTFTKPGLKKGKSYSFRVRAYKKAGKKKVYGNYSNVKTLKAR